MRIPTEEQERLRSERGIAANEACDNCGAVLGAVRDTLAAANRASGVRNLAGTVKRRSRSVSDSAPDGRGSTKIQQRSNEPTEVARERYEIPR